MDLLGSIKQMEQELSYGTLHITVKRHDSQTVGIEGKQELSHKVADNPGALAIIITLLKTVESNRATGKINCSIDLCEGQATRVVIEETHRTARAVA